MFVHPESKVYGSKVYGSKARENKVRDMRDMIVAIAVTLAVAAAMLSIQILAAERFWCVYAATKAENGKTYDIDKDDIEVKDSNISFTVNGSTSSHNIKVDGDKTGVTINLSGTYMDLSGKEKGCVRIEGGAKVVINVSGTCTLRGGHDTGIGQNTGHSAIYVDSDAELILNVNGTLYAHGGGGGENRGSAGIGGDDDEDSGKISIAVNNGSVLDAYGADGGAGIGGGDGHSAKKPISITLNGTGKLQATAGFDGSGGGAGIGGGDGGGSNDIIDITMNDTSSITSIGNHGGAGIGGGNDGGYGDITITMADSTSITATGDDGAAGIGGGDDGSISNINIKSLGNIHYSTGSGTSITATGDGGGAGIGSGSDGKLTSIVANGIDSLKCKGGSKAAGFGGGDHDGTGDGGNIGDVTVKNCKYVEAAGGDGAPGIGGGEDADIGSITVQDCGEVKATGGNDGAGIGTGRDSGAGKYVDCGPITVKNSKVTAVCSGGTGAGIGSGCSAHVGKITITGEYDITATGCGDGAGIGYSGTGVDNLNRRYADQIEITNVKGNLTATAGSNAAGIGLGDISLDGDEPNKGLITIAMAGGTITAKGTGTNNAGIGGGRGRGGSTIKKIKITGSGTINATGTTGGSAIGSGDDANITDGIEITGDSAKEDGSKSLVLNVTCTNTDKDPATCPMIGIDDPVNDKDDATDIIIKNTEINCTVSYNNGRGHGICIGGGQSGGMAENTGWLRKVSLENCKVRMKGDSGAGLGGNQRVSVDEIDIIDTDYEGFAVGSFGYADAMIFSGETTTNMNTINIKNSKVKAIATQKTANDSYAVPMAGIGGGNKTKVGNINISNSTVTAQGIFSGAGIGGGGYLYDSSFLGDFFTVYGDMGDYFGDTISITDSTVTATGSPGLIYEYDRMGCVLTPDGTLEPVEYKTRQFTGCAAGIGGGGFQSFKNIDLKNSTITATGAGTTNHGTWFCWDDAIDSGAAGIGGGSMGTSQKITIDNCKVDSTGTFAGAGIGAGGKDYQIQKSLLKMISGDPGKADVPEITIKNNSDITAYGGFYGAGIGCGERGALTKIDIQSSKINAVGGEGGAGIGGGLNTDISKAEVSISGSSDVTAQGGTGGAGIGTGINFDKHNDNPDGAYLFKSIDIEGGARVHAAGGSGAAGLGGGAGGNKYLESELRWDSGDDMAAGFVYSLTVKDGALAVASAGKNCISENEEAADHDKTYSYPAIDIGRGGSFLNDTNPAHTLDIDDAALLSKDFDKYMKWTDSYRGGASVFALGPNTEGKHLDSANSSCELYRVTMLVPGISDYTRVGVQVDGDGSEDAKAEPYYSGQELYTDQDGMLYLWLRAGEEDKTTAKATVDGKVYHYKGTSKTDNTGNLKLISEVKVEDTKKVYDGQPIDEPPLSMTAGYGDITYTYFRGDHSGETPEELKNLDPIARSEAVDAAVYTVLVEISETETSGYAYDTGTCTVLPADTTITSLTATRDDSGKVTLTAAVYGLVSGETGCGTIEFKAEQEGIERYSGSKEVGADGTASVDFDASAAAGDYHITAVFRCDPDKPNYNDSQPYTVTYSLEKVDVLLSLDKITGMYLDDPIDMPDPDVDVLDQNPDLKPADIAEVKSMLVCSLEKASLALDDPTVSFDSGTGKITILNAGAALMKFSFEGTDRLNSAAILVPVVISRKPVTARPAVSVCEDGVWSNYTDSAVTYYGKTKTDVDLKYKVNYTADSGKALTSENEQELDGVTECVPINEHAPASSEPYEVALIRKKTPRNYDVTLGDPAEVTVLMAKRDLTVTCEDVTYGTKPQPAVRCDVPFAPGELTYRYSGTENSGKTYDSALAPVNAGSYKVTATLSERPNYMTVSASCDFEIKRANIDPHAEVKDHAYGQATEVAVIGNPGKGKVTCRYYKDAECTIPTTEEDGAAEEGGEPRFIGTYYVAAHIAKTDNYNGADADAAEFRITRKTAEVIANDKNKKYGQKDPDLTATVVGLVGNDTIDYTLTREPGEEPGVYRIIASGDNIQGNYAVKFSDGLLTIGDKFTLYFDLGGGSLNGKKGTIKMTGLKYGQKVTIPKAPVKKGYKFLYWKGSKYYPGDKYTVESSHKFTAVWKKKGSGSGGESGSGSGRRSGRSGARTGDSARLTLWLTILVAASLLLYLLLSAPIRDRSN